MTALRPPRSPLVPMLAVIGAVAIALGTQLAAALPAAEPVGLEEPLLEMPAPRAGAASDPLDASDADAELARVRDDVSFWAVRLEASPADVVAAVRLADASAAEARLTGDVTAWSRALEATDAALDAAPGYVPARSSKATILVALHRFAEAGEIARSLLARDRFDPTALSILGDASLEQGDLGTAASAYLQLGLVTDDAAARVRAGRLDFIRGDVAGAIDAHRTAVTAAIDEGLEGDALAFYHVTLGETLLAAGFAADARAAFEAALLARPGLPAALVGAAKLDAFEGDVDLAIAALDRALAAIPSPEWLALRATMLEARGGVDDARAAVADRATIEAIASLAGDAGDVHGRSLVRYLSDRGLEPARAVALARAELTVRRDIYGHDALAWALANAGEGAAADTAMRAALAEGTQDARLWYHAGVIASELGRVDEARRYLSDALALGPALDPAARERAQATLDSLR
jgi:tetratricopeptide (TPR) repeat protein